MEILDISSIGSKKSSIEEANRSFRENGILLKLEAQPNLAKFAALSFGLPDGILSAAQLFIVQTILNNLDIKLTLYVAVTATYEEPPEDDIFSFS